MSKNDDDRRVRRTRDKLGDALIELLQEKPFDDITVQDVLDRAQVGRSTFYVHYKDKHDLFFSDAEEFLEGMAHALDRSNDPSRRVAPVRELFAHVGFTHKLYDALVKSGRMSDFFELAEACFARGIEVRLSKLAPRAEGYTLQAQALAGALLSMLRSWMQQSARRPASEMDELFHELVWRGVQKA